MNDKNDKPSKSKEGTAIFSEEPPKRAVKAAAPPPKPKPK